MTETRNRIPNPIYAAAGAGELAYKRLRKLPERMSELPARMADLRGDAERDVARLRDSARRNAAAFMSSAQAAQERANAIYTDLVARGEQVVRGRNGTNGSDPTGELSASPDGGFGPDHGHNGN